MPSTRLTIYLLGEEVSDYDQALNRDKTGASVELSPTSGLEGIFSYESRPTTPPAWVSFVGPLLAPRPPRLLWHRRPDCWSSRPASDCSQLRLATVALFSTCQGSNPGSDYVSHSTGSIQAKSVAWIRRPSKTWSSPRTLR